jgi:hypothetical protein
MEGFNTAQLGSGGSQKVELRLGRLGRKEAPMQIIVGRSQGDTMPHDALGNG